MKTRSCILILGMHRSGTSALAGSLSMAGVYFGKSVVTASYDNPKGFYENYQIQDLNDEILKSLGSSWSELALLPEEWWMLPEIRKFENRAQQLIREEYGNHALFSIKDPRISLLLPFWERVLRGIGITTSAILSIRQPEEIVASLSRRDFFSEERSYLLIAKHLLFAIHYSADSVKTIVDYDDLLQRPVDIIKAAFSDLNIDLELGRRAEEEILEFINSDLRNYSKVADKASSTLIESPKDVAENIYHILSTRTLLSFEEVEIELERYERILKAVSPIEDFYCCKLLIDYGSGYSEKDSLIKPIDKKTSKIKFDLANNERNNVFGLKFFPSNARCSLRLNSLDIQFEGVAVAYELSNNSYSMEGNLLHFDTRFPQIIIDFKKKDGVKVKSFSIEIEYLSLGKMLINSEERNISGKRTQKRSMGYLSSVFLILKYPISFLSNLNVKNLRTLRSALKRESPQQILRNFKKLLSQKDHQKLIEEQENTAQSEFFDSYDERGILDNGGEIIWQSQEKDRYRKRSIFYVVPSLPEFDTSSGGKRASRMLTMLAQKHDVTIVCLGAIIEKYREIFERQSISVIEGKDLDQNEMGQVNVVIYAWYYTWFDAAAIRGYFPTAITIIDTVDIHWVREERSIGIVEGMDSGRVERNKKREVQAYYEVDIVWVVSKPDQEAVLTELPESDVRLVSNIHDVMVHNYIEPDTNNLLFFGGFTHYPNISAVQLLANEILPKVRLRAPEAQLLIAGANAPLEVSELGKLDGVTFLGFIEENHIKELYQKTKLCIAPLLMGAGIKGKICEAIAYRTPVVTNAIGNEGIGLIHGKSGIIEEEFGEMSNQIVLALRGEYDLDQMTALAQEQLSLIVGPDVVQSQMLRSFYRNIDICIVTWNRKDLLKNCIDSILSNTLYPNFNIVVYSNGCSDGTVEYLKELETEHLNISVILSESNDVFVRPNNRMMQMNLNHDVVLLNNDVVVTSGWLYGLYDTAYIDSAVGIVGSKILNPDGSLQEYGAELYEDGTGRNIGRGDRADLPEYNGNRAVGYVSGCSMFIKRSTIDKIGVFDDQFHPCYCEDSDYCYTAWEKDLQTLVTSTSTIYHHEGSTSGIDEENGFKRYQTINMEKFWLKHQSSIKRNRKSIKKANSHLKVSE